MISVDDYFKDSITNYDYTPSSEDWTKAQELLDKVNGLWPDAKLRSGHRTRQKTLDLIAKGYKAALNDAHENSNGVDVSDDDNSKDAALTDQALETAGLYREHPGYTPTWVHLQQTPPGSGHRTFIP